MSKLSTNSKDQQIQDLTEQNKILTYERDGLQKRLNRIRASKAILFKLLDTPTLEEHLKAQGKDATVF